MHENSFFLFWFCLLSALPCRPIGLMKRFEVNQLNYRFPHPVAALQSNLTKDIDKYSKIRFDYASFDAQVFGKQSLMAPHQDPDLSSHFPDGEPLMSWWRISHRNDVLRNIKWRDY